MHNHLRLVLVALLAGSAVAVGQSGVGYAAPPGVASYVINPTPIAPPGSLTRGSLVHLRLTARDAGGSPVVGVPVYVSFSAPGIGTATANGKRLSSSPSAFTTNSMGQIGLGYRAPQAVPSSGIDTISAANSPTGATVTASVSYNYAPPAADPEDWAMFHHDPQHLAVSPDTTIGAAKAATLTTKWNITSGQVSDSSPAVVFNQQLKKSLLYVGGKDGFMNAFDAATGTRVWQHQVGSILSSPAVVDNTIYFGSADHNIYAMDVTTGNLVCKYLTTGRTTSSPVVADPDGNGKVVYIGDSGPSGGPDGGNMWAIDARTCALRWRFTGFGSPPGSQPLAGVYSQPGFALDPSGRPLVVFGSTDPDDAIYALDARTGTLVWRFQTLVVHDGDVGAGPTISAPGVNGLAHGAVYETGKDDITYALDLTTGAQLWATALGPPTSEAQSVAALVGSRLFLGYSRGLYALDAVTGAVVWNVSGLPPIFSSPAVSGAPGDQVLLVGDVGGTLRAYDLNGNLKWSTTVGGAILCSPAISRGMVFIDNHVTDDITAFAPA